jgi:hypothetical protein
MVLVTVTENHKHPGRPYFKFNSREVLVESGGSSLLVDDPVS